MLPDISTLSRSELAALLAAIAARLATADIAPPPAAVGAESLLTAKQMAERLNVPESKVRSEQRAGHIPCVMVGRYVRFDPNAVQAALNKPGKAG
jgi:excisionase family DNA binding protein